MVSLMENYCGWKNIRVSKMIPWLWIIVLTLLSFRLSSQELILRINEQATDVSIDPFTNLYILTSDQEIKKIQHQGEAGSQSHRP